MHKRVTYSIRTFWRIGLLALAIGILPGLVRSQEASTPPRDSASATASFEVYNDSLTMAADSLLASSAQAVSSSTEKKNVDATPINSFPTWEARRSMIENKGSTIAASRLEVLRPVVEPILQRHGVPAELASVILVESGGRSDALSPKGARGLWQLMPETARRYGLRVDSMEDDRLDLFRATDAAGGYLHDLYAQFGDWKLALAAYNTGEANVGNAISKAHTQDFDQLSKLGMLPLETRNYVPRVLAAAQSTTHVSSFGNSRNAGSATTVFASSAIRGSKF